MSKTLLIGLVLALHSSLALGQALPAPADAWQSVFFNSPATALPLLTAAAITHSADLQALEIDKSLGEQNLKLARKAILNSVGVGAGYTYGNQASIGPATRRTPTSSALIVRAATRWGLTFRCRGAGGQPWPPHQEGRAEHSAQRGRAAGAGKPAAPANYSAVRERAAGPQGAHPTAGSLCEHAYRPPAGRKAVPAGPVELAGIFGGRQPLTSASVAQETARSQYDTAFLLLEEVVGAKISTLMTSPTP